MDAHLSRMGYSTATSGRSFSYTPSDSRTKIPQNVGRSSGFHPPRLERHQCDVFYVDTVSSMTSNAIHVAVLTNHSLMITVFQIQKAFNDPITRTVAFISLIFALNSLCSGIVLYMNFRTMKTMYKGFHWAKETERTRTHIVWNVCVLLSLPTIWFAW
jgi:hypothetical protein